MITEILEFERRQNVPHHVMMCVPFRWSFQNCCDLRFLGGIPVIIFERTTWILENS